MAGHMRDSLGLRNDANKLWSQALTLAEQECQALGLKERQVEFPTHHCHTRLASTTTIAPSWVETPCYVASMCVLT